MSTSLWNHNEALENLEEARQLAEKHNYKNELRRIHCLIGVAKGVTEFANINENIINNQVSL